MSVVRGIDVQELSFLCSFVLICRLYVLFAFLYHCILSGAKCWIGRGSHELCSCTH